ncbi:UNVERIFIED_CONTAM: hypothetical protein K2H54_062073 [Gekko kuhli]
MGRTNAAKTKKNLNASSTVSSYFTKNKSEDTLGKKQQPPSKMAAAEESDREDNAPLSRRDYIDAFRALKDDIADQIQTAVQKAIQPLSNELKIITETLTEVAQAATAAQEDVKSLQLTEDWTKNKIMALENRMRDRNLKFRGIPENSEG